MVLALILLLSITFTLLSLYCFPVNCRTVNYLSRSLWSTASIFIILHLNYMLVLENDHFNYTGYADPGKGTALPFLFNFLFRVQ